MVGIATVLLTWRFSSSNVSIMFKSDDLGGGVDDIYVVCIQICSSGPRPMDWSTIMQQLHYSVVSQQWNDLRIQHFVLIASCSSVPIYKDNVGFMM